MARHGWRQRQSATDRHFIEQETCVMEGNRKTGSLPPDPQAPPLSASGALLFDSCQWVRTPQACVPPQAAARGCSGHGANV